MSSRWDEVKSIPIDEVAQRLGVSLPKRTVMRCPFPGHEDNNPSFSIDRRKNLCYCHACGRGGSVIDFAAILTGKPPSEIVSWLSDSAPFRTSKLGQARNSIRETLEGAKATFSPDFTVYEHFASLCPPSLSGRQYLLNRAISAKTQDAFRIGFVGDSEQLAEQLLKAHGKEKLSSCGLIYPNRVPKLVFSSDSLLLPFVVKGQITYFQSRSVSNLAKRWMGLNGVRKPAIFNVDALSQSKSVHLCEGVTDVLSAYELGLPAIGLTGAHTKIPADFLNIMRGKTIYIIPDNDPAGASMEIQVTKSLRSAGIQSIVQRVPHGKDLNDYLVSRKRR